MEIPSRQTRRIFWFAEATTGLPKEGLVDSDMTVYLTRDRWPTKTDPTPRIGEVDATNQPGWYWYRVDYNNEVAQGHMVEELLINLTATGMNQFGRTVTLKKIPGDITVVEDIKTYYIDDYGYDMEHTVYDFDGETVKDISSYTTSKEIAFISPKGQEYLKTAAFKTDGTDGILKYQRAAGNFDEKGSWLRQCKVQTGTEVYRDPLQRFEMAAIPKT